MKRSRLHFMLAGIFLWGGSRVLFMGQTSSSKPAQIPMMTYPDPAGDVSFEYPAVWKIDNKATFSLPPRILASGLSPQVQVVFLPEGNLYEHTNLYSLLFVYAKTPQPSPEACTKLATGPDAVKTDTVAIHGISFQHFSAEDASMCHQTKQQIYSTYRNGSCYLFEGDLNTICAGVVDGQRELTAAELRALERHLNAIPQSIRFAPGK